MSVSLILVPAALAVAGIVAGAGTAGVLTEAEQNEESAGSPRPRGAVHPAVTVQTRMKDAALLGEALQTLGATAVRIDDAALSALVGDLELRMTRDDDGIWTAHVSGADGREADRAEAQTLIERMDAAYARQVQQAVAARIRERAGDAGFELMSETRESDESVTMVLAVREER